MLRGFALCSVLVYLSLAKAEAVTQGLEQSLCCAGRLGNCSVGAETPSSGEKPGGNTWGLGHVGGERVGERGFIVAMVGQGGWRALEVALQRGKRIWQALVWRKWDIRGRIRCVKALALAGMNKGDEGDSLDRRELRG